MGWELATYSVARLGRNKCQGVRALLKLVGFLNAMGFTSLLLRSSAVWPFHAEFPLPLGAMEGAQGLLRAAAQQQLPQHQARANTCGHPLAPAWHHDSCGHEPSAGVELNCSASAPVCETDPNRGREGKPHTGANGMGEGEASSLPLPHPLTGDTAGGGVGWLH